MNAWQLGTAIVAAVLFLGIATRGLSYIHKYRGPAPKIGAVLFWTAMVLLALGLAGVIWYGFLAYQLFVEQSSIAQDEQVVRYTVIGQVVYITACVLWCILLGYMVSRHRSHMKMVLSSSFNDESAR